MENDIARSGGAAVGQELERLCGELAPGSALPSTRELQRRHQVSALTVQRVLAALARQGRLVVHPGRGSFVAANRSPRRPDLSWQTTALGQRDDLPDDMSELYRPVGEGVIDLMSAYLDPSLQPTALLAQAATRAARRPLAWDRAPVEGIAELRALVAGMVGADFEPDDVLITSSGQAALSLAFRALARPGDPVLFEHATYPGALAVARAAGLRPVPVVADLDGVQVDALDAALVRTGARLVYLQPRYSNPTGSVLAPGRRPEVLAVLARHDALAIEDDWVSLLDLDGPSPAPLASGDSDGHVVHLLSLSKAVAPGLRIAAVTARGAATARLRRARMTDELFVAPVLQHTAVELLGAPGWSRHLATVRRELRSRRQVLVTALVEHVPGVEVGSGLRLPAGGVHLWVPLPAHVDDRLVATRARMAGVVVAPGSAYTLGEPTAPYVRVAFARSGPGGLMKGAERLGAVVRTAQ
jgi:DNA-binding transcriptional MocR family regulator